MIQLGFLIFGVICGMIFQTWWIYRKDAENMNDKEMVIEYYSNRLKNEQLIFQKQTKDVFRKMYSYRNKLEELGIDLPEGKDDHFRS